ncbi:MAG: DUF6519 domain-containing protein [Blastocatellia bacterium]
MKNDISRDTFNPAKRFARVLMQQGRVQLDADFNEQTAIFWHYIRMLATDIIGPFGGPAANLGFGILPRSGETSHLTKREQLRVGSDEDLKRLVSIAPSNTLSFIVMRGRYYVEGLLAENDADFIYQTDGLKLSAGFIIYLDVWERHVSALEDDSIREVALGGPDTATRAQLTWQIRIYTQENDNDRVPPNRDGEIKKPLGALTAEEVWNGWQKYVDAFQPHNRGRLLARVESGDGATANEPCIIHPDARYRGAENQLYRVEIHTGDNANTATFKWSRENGSVTFPILEMNGGQARVAHLGRDAHLGLQVNDWVEVVDDERALAQPAWPLLQVAEVRPMDSQVVLKAPSKGGLPVYKREDQGKHPYLRRWDQRRDVNAEGVIVITKGSDKKNAGWIDLEDNVQIRFADPANGSYRAGDYWLIAARTTTRDVEWPRDDKEEPLALPPHGVRHYYAPLALWLPGGVRSAESDSSSGKRARKEGAGSGTAQPAANSPVLDLRRVFNSLTDTE